MDKIKWIAPIFMALAMVWHSYSPAAAQTPTPTATPVPSCDVVLFDWTEGDTSLQGWSYYTQEGTVTPLAVVSNALEGVQSGAGLSGYRASSTVSEIVQPGDVIKSDSETAGGQISGGIFLLFDGTPPDNVLADSKSIVSGGLLGYSRQVHAASLDDRAGQEITSAVWWNRDAQSGSRTYRIYKIWIERGCGTPTPTPTPAPIGGQILCPLVENANFSDDEGWLLTGISEIENGALTMAGVGSASQNVTVQPLLTYDSVISVTETSEISPTIGISLGSQGEVLVVGAGTYTSTFTTPGVIGGPLQYLIENQSANSVQINFACIQLADGTGERVCIAPDNGEFDTAEGWAGFGSIYDGIQGNMKLPDQPPGQVRTTDTYTMPTVSEGEYLIFSYDARSELSTGLIGGALSDIVNNEWFETFAETFAEWYTYESDVSSFAEQPVELRFLAPGIDPITDTRIEGAVRLDNVCIFLSDQPPAQLPYPSDPNTPPRVDFGDFYSCDDTDQIIYDLVGVDMRYHRTNYETVPGFFDFSDWVPWLVSAFWFGVSFYLCLFLILIQTMVNIVEFIANNWLNIFNWVYLTAWAFFTNWLPTTMANILRTFFNFGVALLITMWDWGLWIGLAALAFGFFLPVALLFVLFGGLLWLYYGLVWVADYFSEFFDWLIIEVFNFFKGDLLNNLILAWNDFSETIGVIFSWLYDTFIIWLWNPIIVPFLQALLGMFNPLFLLIYLISSILGIIPIVWGFVWSILEWLWENVWQVVNMPLSFYIGLQDGVQSNAFGSLLDCSTPSSFWCAYLAGLDLINSIAGASIFYPIVIISVILGTFMVFRKHGAAGWEIIIKSIENF